MTDKRVPEEYQSWTVYDRSDGNGMCPVDPLYCSRRYDHACVNMDSAARGYVIFGRTAREALAGDAE